MSWRYTAHVLTESTKMTPDDKADALRELDKIEDALSWAVKHHLASSESNAALHCSERVMYTPLANKLSSAVSSIGLVRARIGE